jgi:hypothetical protein
MCKKIIGGITVIAIAAVAVWNVSVNLNSQKNELSDISLANIEALGQEVGFDPGVYYIVNVTANSHSCYKGGPFSCNID